MVKQSTAGRAFKAAFPYTIPILAGFTFLGMSYGIYMSVSGFPVWFAPLISVTVFGGSMQFVMVNMLVGVFNPIQAFTVSLMVQARHLFYSIAMLDRFKGLGWKKFYVIFGMCDETFSINCSTDVPEGIDKGWFMFWVTALDHIYWVCGSALGGVVGSMLTMNTEGLEFVMTAMFVVIFLEQWLKDESHLTAIIGVGSSVLCLLVFGATNFLIPAMCLILGLVTLCRTPIEKKAGDLA